MCGGPYSDALKPAPKKAKKSKFKIPKKPGECADLLYTLRADRLALEKQAEEIKVNENALKEHLIATLGKDQAAVGVIGNIATVKVIPSVIPVATDWDAIWEYIQKNKATDMLQRRLNDKAVKDRWENGVSVPGVDKMSVDKVSVTKC